MSGVLSLLITQSKPDAHSTHYSSGLHLSTMPIFSVAQGSLTLPGLSAFLSQHQQLFTTTDHAHASSSSPFFTITTPLFIPPSRTTRRSTHNITAKFSLSDNAKAENSNETATTTATNAFLEPSPDDLLQARRSADWKAIKAYCEGGLIFQGKVEGFNSGGLIVRFYSLVGFLPFPLLSPSHSCKEPLKTIHEIAKDLNGSLISVKVIHAEEENRKLIFSEKEAVWSQFSKRINVGDIFVGRVGSVEDYGAFIHLRFPDGLYHLTGLVHVSEVSWDLVQDVRDILNVGDEVTVKIIDIDQEKSRITLSIKQLEEDPLLETLDKVIPQDGSVPPYPLSMQNSFSIEPLPGLESIFQELLQEDGIDDIKINRQGFEKRVVSQDLQIWLSNAPPINRKFTLLARAGRQVQEIQLTTTLGQDGIKKALQRVLERVP